MNKAAFRGLFLAVLLVGAAARLGRLDLRPMHHDEANQAVKFGTLLEKGEYRYDPADHHGPTLYYLTLPAAWARGQKTLSSLDETTLRLIPALFGIGLLLLFLFLKRELGRPAVLLGALFAALSPALTYYSRFYIQESLFVFFSIFFMTAVGKYAACPSARWAAAAGVAAGLAFATKETSIFVFIAAAIGLAAGLLCRRPWKAGAVLCRPSLGHLVLAAAAAAATAFVFFSSFLKNPRGPLEALTAFTTYASRGLGADVHAQPWFYYLKTLIWTKSDGIVWSEGIILGLALVGIIAAFTRMKRRDESGFWPVYLVVSTLVLAFAYSAISYKTPWNLAVFQSGFAVLAGIGASALVNAVRPRIGRAAVLLLILIGAAQLGRQNLSADFRYPADPRNPYAYAQTSPDFLRLVDRVRQLAAIHPHRKNMLIKVVAEADQQWPLPWSLRDFRRIGYWTRLVDAGEIEGVPIVIASRRNAEIIERTAGDAFQIEYYGLRPGVLLTVFIDRELWNAFLERRSDIRS